MVGQHYIDVMADLHDAVKPGWYLGIGNPTGRSDVILAARHLRRGRIAIDPVGPDRANRYAEDMRATQSCNVCADVIIETARALAR